MAPCVHAPVVVPARVRMRVSALSSHCSLPPRIDRTRRGLGAVRELRKGELVLKVPRNALLTTESMVAKDQNLGDSINLHASLSSTQVLFSLSSDALLRKSHNLRIFCNLQILSVCLLYEMSKGKSSFWHPYLVHLPRDYDLLATFGDFEKRALQVLSLSLLFYCDF